MKMTSSWFLYALAITVSIVGIHLYVGVSLYLSRLVLIFLIASLVIKGLKGSRIPYPPIFLYKFFLIFTLILIFQFYSTMISTRVPEGLRQIAIYAALMCLFFAVVITSRNIESILTAIKLYLFVGITQGLYGMYQIIGGRQTWPTYQTLLQWANIQTTNDHTDGGYIYSRMYDAYRAIGFYPADVSHYAGYMVGIVIIAIAYHSFNMRAFFPKAAVIIGVSGLVLSLSRSGIIALFFVGLPIYLYLLWRMQAKDITRIAISSIILLTLGITLAYTTSNLSKVNFREVSIIKLLGANTPAITSEQISPATTASEQSKSTPTSFEESVIAKALVNRFSNLLKPSSSSESLNEHIETRLAGLNAFISHPLLGVGLGVNAKPWLSEKSERGWAGSHSHHLDILGQTGLIGALLQFIFMYMVGASMWKGIFVTKEKSFAKYILAGIFSSYVAILIGNFMYHYFTLDIVWFLMGCGVALSHLLILNTKKSYGLNPFI